MPRLPSLACAILFAAAVPALSAEEHDHSSKHGGVIVEAGHHHLEVVAKDGLIEVHVEGEDGMPESVSGAKATAAVLSEGKKVDVALEPSGDNVLKGSGAFKAAKGTVIVLTLTMADHEPEQVRLKLD